MSLWGDDGRYEIILIIGGIVKEWLGLLLLLLLALANESLRLCLPHGMLLVVVESCVSITYPIVFLRRSWASVIQADAAAMRSQPLDTGIGQVWDLRCEIWRGCRLSTTVQSLLPEVVGGGIVGQHGEMRGESGWRCLFGECCN